MNYKNIIFSGTSMTPFLKAGDRIYLCRTSWNKLRIGDLVSVGLLNSKHPVIHRLVGWQYRKNIRYGILKGDSLPQKDSFFLSRHNYLGRVCVRERNGKRLFLDSPGEKIKAGLFALFSVLNLTPGVLRLKIKRILESLKFQIPGIKIVERCILARARYFVFSDQRNTKRLRAVYRNITVGEILFQGNPLRVIHSSVFSVFSAIILPDKLTSNAAARFPELFGADVKKNVKV